MDTFEVLDKLNMMSPKELFVFGRTGKHVEYIQAMLLYSKKIKKNKRKEN